MLPDVFRFRDAIAHGKTKPVRRPDQPFPDTSKEEWDEGLERMIRDTTAEWERACEPATIKLWMEAIEEMIRQLHRAFTQHPKLRARGFFETEPPDPFTMKSYGYASVKVKKPPEK